MVERWLQRIEARVLSQLMALDYRCLHGGSIWIRRSGDLDR